MTKTNMRVHIHGQIGNTPTTNDPGDYVRYTFTVIPNGSTEPVQLIAWGYKDFPSRYSSGDKVIISGSRVTVKNTENGKMKCRPVVRAETIILEH